MARGAQKKPDLVEGIACASAVTGRVLLDATTHLIESVTGELDDVKGVQHAGGVLELVIDGVLGVPGRDLASRFAHPARKSFPRSASQFLYTVPDLPGTRSNKRAVGCSSPQVRSTMPVSSRGPSSASVLVMPHMLINPQHPNPCEAGGVLRCGLQTRLDMGPHGVPRGS